MASSMSSYCSKDSKKECRDFTDGSNICLCIKGWSVFFATLNKHGWDDKKPRPHSVSETVFNKALEEGIKDIVGWFEETYNPNKCNGCQ